MVCIMTPTRQSRCFVWLRESHGGDCRSHLLGGDVSRGLREPDGDALQEELLGVMTAVRAGRRGCCRSITGVCRSRGKEVAAAAAYKSTHETQTGIDATAVIQRDAVLRQGTQKTPPRLAAHSNNNNSSKKNTKKKKA